MAKRNLVPTGLGWFLMLAATATAAGAAATLFSRRRIQRRVAHLEHKADIKSWENEGGNS
ncbi:MAG: hypothetical protein ABIR98_04175 [Usitatibacter sp.]